MFPFIDLFGIHIPTYGLSALAGIAAASVLVFFRLRGRKDYSKSHMIIMLIFAFIGAFVCAHILYAITRIDFLITVIKSGVNIFSSADIFLTVFAELFGGMVFYGGMIGALLGAFIYCKATKLDFDTYTDIFAPAIPLFHAFGRVGCVFAGCCYGIEASWGLPYPVRHSDGTITDTVTRLPVPLIEAGFNLIIMMILLFLSKKNFKKGSLLSFYFIMYSVVRFTDEFFRGDEIRGRLFALTTSQWISIRRYVFKSKERFGYNVPKGEVPEGYAYHPYTGAIPPHEIEKYKLLLERSTAEK